MAVLTIAAISCKGTADETIDDYKAISLPGVNNSRQLGGYRIGDKTIRQNVLLRSGALANASDEALGILQNEYHLAYVFDFRSSYERDSAPDREVAGAENVWLPCLERVIRESAETKPEISEMFRNRKNLPALFKSIQDSVAVEYLKEVYTSIVFDEDNQKSYAAFLDSLVVLPEGHAALWHCTHGKDRTGWGSTFVLAALGADRDLIVQNFAASNKSYQEDIDRITAEARAQGLGEDVVNNLITVLGVNPSEFERTLDLIDARYGSMDNFLETELELTPEEKSTLRNTFLE